MRTIPFKQVLWGVAHKFSLDPEQSNFLTNQAIPLGEYIDQWIRRLYDARDWPEWVVTGKFAPANHVVTWDALQIEATTHEVKIGRVIKVFLIDPVTTDSPIDTPFTLTDTGIHCGYEHGAHVWIRYLAPPPRFTAAQWDAGTTYQLDDVAYSYTSGEVYRSKVNSNLGHDPVSNFSVPPNPFIGHPPHLPAPPVEVTQEFAPDNVGIAERNQILRVYLLGSEPGPDPVDPPPNLTTFEISITDEDGVPVVGGDAVHVANGSESLLTILTDLYDQLVLNLPGDWTVSKNDTNLTIDIQNASTFGFIAPAGFVQMTPPTGLPESNLKVGFIQSYIPTFSAASGQPQISQITITPDTTYPGAIYTLSVTDSSGVEHSVEYASALYDDSAQILQGVILAVEADTADTFWTTVQLTFDPTGITLDVAVRDTVGVMLRPAPTGSGYWELVPFPKAIADAVMRGAIADLDREWGQDAKADSQEGQVGNESGIIEAKYTTMPDPPLTGQERGNSRYRMQQ